MQLGTRTPFSPKALNPVSSSPGTLNPMPSARWSGSPDLHNLRTTALSAHASRLGRLRPCSFLTDTLQVCPRPKDLERKIRWGQESMAAAPVVRLRRAESVEKAMHFSSCSPQLVIVLGWTLGAGRPAGTHLSHVSRKSPNPNDSRLQTRSPEPLKPNKHQPLNPETPKQLIKP